jgi:hypothetical protein
MNVCKVLINMYFCQTAFTCTHQNQGGANPRSECASGGPRQNGYRGQPGQGQTGYNEQQTGNNEEVLCPT